MTLKRADWDGLDVWCGWEKRGYPRKCYTQKLRENNQEEDPEPDEYMKLEGFKNERGEWGE